MKTNQVKQLNFSGAYIEAKYVENVENYYINNRTIAVNPQESDAYLKEANISIIPAFSSTILNDTVVKEAKSLLLLEVVETKNIGKIIFESQWDILGNLDPGFPKDVPLYKSPQDEAGIIEIDPYFMTRQSSKPDWKEQFSLKVNLWYAPSLSDCAIHNQHDFIEIHTQIFGKGRMQKFKEDDFGTLYEDLFMSEGYTTVLPFCQVHKHQKYTYPWHQYYADTDCIWMAIEYHPIKTSK
ncbi:hypothetical protein [Mastigocoleus testarum]|uniref:Uncharacterized protein n=1 Tax=Mastigocoleus testarum BC008 TaxID=371196 RepID=A0A0V7ZT81_9CYAN|nr:hypothetical protein [Mastigocoleus testarum]KST67876.1 hypothetical protein BC008_31310 [Mastigocoleus testarum BC008]